GNDSAPTPKDLVLAALCGCTAMDVVSLMKKYKEPLEKFSVEAETHVRASHPAIFGDIHLTFRLEGNLDKQKVVEAVRLSETQYCSVGAMLSKAVPIHYSVELNGVEIARGQAGYESHLLEPNEGIA
ncbi:MAG: OsmC family protein, partial [Bdellovibrionota bacterium]